MTEQPHEPAPPSPMDERPGDSLLAIAEMAVGLQPAAEAVIQVCAADEPPLDVLRADGDAIIRAYSQLQERLRALRSGEPIEVELAELLDEHLRRVSEALDVAFGPQAHMARRTLTGLGPPAGQLIALRDRLRRTADLAGRRVQDLPLRDRS